MNTAQQLQKKWKATPDEMAQRLSITRKTALNWLAGGNPKDVGKMLLYIAAEENNFDIRRLSTETREQYTATEWIKFLMQKFGDYRLAQFARRLNLNFATVSAWNRSKRNRLKGSAEALLLYAHHNPHKFPTR